MEKKTINFIMQISIIVLFAIIAFGSNTQKNVTQSSTSSVSVTTAPKGSSRENAIPVSVGFSSSYNISSSGALWFKFVGTGEPVIFETRGNVVATRIERYEISGGNLREIEHGNWSEDRGEGANALVSNNTTLGQTYYIKVTPRNGTSGTYTFVVTAPFFNIRTNPITIAVGNSSSHVISGGQHWFKFTGDGKRVFFETEGIKGNAKISIYNEENTNASYSWDKQGNFITVSGTTYFICIIGSSTGILNRSGTYTLNLRHGIGDGSSLYYAKEVTKEYLASHNIIYGGEHWFIYQGTGEPVTFKTTGDVVATRIDLYEFRGSIREVGYGSWSENRGEGSNALVTNSTTSGQTYFIKVTPRNGTKGEYNFVVE
jgi:hypothetical protein